MTSVCVVCAHQLKPVFEKNSVPVKECADRRYRAADLDVPNDHTDRLFADDYFSDGGDG